MNAQTARAQADRALMQALLETPRVRDLLRQLEQADEPYGTRRNLLARALRLTRAVAPDTWAIVDHCAKTLDCATTLELYVFPSPQFNAACTPPENGRVFILLSSALLEAFDDDELTFVIGHELGHHVYDHHAIPLGLLLGGQGQLPVPELLQITAWQRHAEISADRAGLLCCGALEPAARALFKLSSGLAAAPDAARIQAFIQQADELYREADAATSPEQQQHHDWLASHPFSPIRLKAAQLFTDSRAFQHDEPMEPLEEQVHELMALMDPSYLHEDSEAAEAMRRLLFAAGAVVAGAHDGVSKVEIEALASLLGHGKVPRRLDPELLRGVMGGRIDDVNAKVRPARRAQLVRDLAHVARADGHVHPQELAVLHEVARALELRPGIVEAAVSEPLELD